MAEEAQTQTQTPPPKQKPKATDAKFEANSYRVQCTSRMVGTLFDPERKLRISKNSDVKVSGPIEPGSWLHCQIKAGLVEFVAD